MTAPTPNAMPGAATASAPPQADPPTPPEATPPAPEPPAAPDNRPPWERSGEKFDPERAWKLIQNKDADAQKARDELAAYKDQTDPVVAEREQLRRASQSESDRLKEDLASAAQREETWRTQAVRSKAEALASGRFVDAETALALIGDVSQFATDDGIDVAKLTARLDQLAADKPFLVAAPPQPPGFTPNRAQAQSGTGSVPLDAQIKAAQDRGDFQASIALKQQQRYQQQTR